jgi:hypothetical protein
MPGWVDNWGGPTERLVQTGCGIIRHMEALPDNPLDMIPADMV